MNFVRFSQYWMPFTDTAYGRKGNFIVQLAKLTRKPSNITLRILNQSTTKISGSLEHGS